MYRVNFDMAGDADSKAMHGIANDRSEIAQRIIEKADKSIGATGCDLLPSAHKAPTEKRL